MGILSENPKNEPLHYGEVYDVYMFLAGGQMLASRYQVLANHTGDEELRNFINSVIDERLRPHIEQLKDILIDCGAPLPPAPPERGDADRELIPNGARFTDPEIAAMVFTDHALGAVSDSFAMTQCLREDIADMFVKFHDQKVQDGAKLLRLMKQKGWIVPPPLHEKPREEVQLSTTHRLR